MSKSKKFAVVLSGCGVFDGSEIHEATLSLYFISLHGGTYDIFAPDIPQLHVVNHSTGKEMNEKRNVMVEASRIARGKIRTLSQFRASDYDVLLFPGGYGAAKNLSDWALKGPHCKVLPEVERSILDMVKAGKPVGALCISPVLLACVLKNVEITVGDDDSTIRSVESLGAIHHKTGHGEIVTDRKYKLVTAPCYMLNANIAEVGIGIDALVKALIEMA